MHYTKLIASNNWTLLICLFTIRSLVPFHRCGCQCGKQSWHIVVCWNGWMYWSNWTGATRMPQSNTQQPLSVCHQNPIRSRPENSRENPCWVYDWRKKQLVWRTYCSFFVLHSEATSMNKGCGLSSLEAELLWLFHKGCGLSNLEAELLLQSTNNDCYNANGWLPALMNFRESPWRETNIQ